LAGDLLKKGENRERECVPVLSRVGFETVIRSLAAKVGKQKMEGKGWEEKWKKGESQVSPLQRPTNGVTEKEGNGV